MISYDDLDTAEDIAYKYVAPFLYVLGLSGSLANLVTLHGTSLSARIYTYLKALSLADLGFITVLIPYLTWVANSKNGSEEFQNNYAIATYRLYLELVLINGFVSASVFIVLLMTMDR